MRAPDTNGLKTPFASLLRLASRRARQFTTGRIRYAFATFALAAALLFGTGCHNVPPRAPASPDLAESLPAEQLDPVQAANRQLRALVDGDPAAIRAWEYCNVSNALPALDAADAVLSSTARLRAAFDKAYGPGQLVRLCPTIAAPGAHLPADCTVKIEGNSATISAPGWDERKMIRVNGVWRQDLTALNWSEVLEHFKREGAPPLPLDRLIPNLQAMAAILDRTADEVQAGAYLSCPDAFGVLNARLHGLAYRSYPLYLALGTDVTDEAARLAKAAAPEVPIIQLRGNSTALGMSQSQQLGKSIQSVLQDYFGRAFDLSNANGRKTYQRALKVAAGFEPYLRPEHLAEIRSLAAGLGVDPAQAMLGQCFPDLNPEGGCSTISLPAAASADGVARFGRNLDYITLGILNRHTVVLVFHPTDRYAFASVAAAPGLVGVLSGMNEHGLTLAVMEVPRSFRLPHAMPFMLLYRTVLENCRTVDEAIALLRKTPRQSANNLMLMDASGNRVVAEITPAGVTVRKAQDDAALVSTNHQRGKDSDSPGRCIRYDSLHDAARRQFGKLSEHAVEGMLAGVAQGEMTFQSMVFEPANRVLYLAAGAGAPNHGFARIDLKPLFR